MATSIFPYTKEIGADTCIRYAQAINEGVLKPLRIADQFDKSERAVVFSGSCLDFHFEHGLHCSRRFSGGYDAAVSTSDAARS
jgi:hypothetical protein